AELGRGAGSREWGMTQTAVHAEAGAEAEAEVEVEVEVGLPSLPPPAGEGARRADGGSFGFGFGFGFSFGLCLCFYSLLTPLHSLLDLTPTFTQRNPHRSIVARRHRPRQFPQKAHAETTDRCILRTPQHA